MKRGFLFPAWADYPCRQFQYSFQQSATTVYQKGLRVGMDQFNGGFDTNRGKGVSHDGGAWVRRARILGSISFISRPLDLKYSVSFRV